MRPSTRRSSGPILPRVVGDLDGAELYTWVVTAYLLTSTVTVPIYGKLSDLFGRKPLLMIGIGLFLVGSFLSSLSQEMWQLILFRGIQGLGAGSLFPIALAVIGDLFTPAERGKYQGLFGAVFGIAFLVGPGLGGFLTDTWSWHWVFLVNIPIGLVALFVIGRLLPTVRRPDAARNVDYLGVATFSAGLVPILIGLTNAQNGDWGSVGVWGLILLGVAFLGLFVWVESRAPEPMIPLGLFRIPSFTLSMIAVFAAMFGFFGAVVFLPLWFQVVQGSSATASGYNLLPFLFGLIFSSVVSGQLVSRTGHYKWIVVGSLALAVIGLILFTNLRADTPSPVLWFWMAVMGLGIGPTMAVFTIIVQNAVPVQQAGRGDRGPDPLPPGGRHGGADLRLHPLPQLPDHGPAQGAVHGCRRSGTDRELDATRRLDRRRRRPGGRRGPDPAVPGTGPGAGAADPAAVPAELRGRIPPGVQHRAGQQLLAGGGRHAGRGAGHRLPSRAPVARALR